MKLTGAQIILECLLEQGVDTVFGYPGGSVLNIYDELYKYRDKIDHIMTAHEQGASHAADGYARATGKTGVVIATSGPGATNLVTGIATAYMDSTPMVAITGNVSRDLLGRDSFQEVDIEHIVKPVTKASFQVQTMEELAPTIRKAFSIAQDGRKGPVLVDVPKDITALPATYEKAEIKKTEEAKENPKNDQYINEIIDLLKTCKRPLIYAGGGVISSGAAEALTAFAQLLDAPVTCSLMGMGGIPGNHPLYAGNIGMHGVFQTSMATKHADVIIAAGARFSDRVACDRDKFGENATVLQLEIDTKEIHKNVTANKWLLGDVKESLLKLNEKLTQQNHADWFDQIKQWHEETKEIYAGEDAAAQKDGIPTPSHIFSSLNSIRQDDDIVVTDVGQHQMWTAQFCKFNKPRTFLTSGGLGTMGFGLGAAIGAACAKPNSRVFLVTGDGSFHMNIHELVTLKSYGIPIVVLIMNNTVLGMVRQWQKVFYESRFSQTDPHRATDFVGVAKGYGLSGFCVTDESQVEDTLKKAAEMNEPVIIDFRISPDANVLPMIPPGKTVDSMILAID